MLLQIRMPVTDNAAPVREIQDESSINTRVDDNAIWIERAETEIRAGFIENVAQIEHRG